MPEAPVNEDDLVLLFYDDVRAAGQIVAIHLIAAVSQSPDQLTNEPFRLRIEWTDKRHSARGIGVGAVSPGHPLVDPRAKPNRS